MAAVNHDGDSDTTGVLTGALDDLYDGFVEGLTLPPERYAGP